MFKFRKKVYSRADVKVCEVDLSRPSASSSDARDFAERVELLEVLVHAVDRSVHVAKLVLSIKREKRCSNIYYK